MWRVVRAKSSPNLAAALSTIDNSNKQWRTGMDGAVIPGGQGGSGAAGRTQEARSRQRTGTWVQVRPASRVIHSGPSEQIT